MFVNKFSLGFVKTALLEAKIRLKEKHVSIVNNEYIRIESPLNNDSDSMFYFKVFSQAVQIED
jgi:virulence-associated protein VagC